MTICVYLLTSANLEQRLLRSDWFITSDGLGLIEEIGICPIVELLALCESVKKGRTKEDLALFRVRMRAFHDRFVESGEIIMVDLDQSRLAESLFEWDDHIVVGLWPPAANPKVSPAHSIRRLLLRPSNQTWWNGEIFAEAEIIYGSVEETGLDGNA